MNVFEINDSRTTHDFVGVSFSKFKKSHVKNEALKSLINSKVEPACYWVGELICAGHYIDVWELIILFVTKHVHSGNPKLPMYISLRIVSFKELAINHLDEDLNLRNNLKIRELFAEIISTLCYSRKNRVFEIIKIKKKDEFSMEVMKTMLKAPTVSYADIVFKTDDPKELFIAINEFAYHLSDDSKNNYNACYWLEWLLQFDIICKKNKQGCISERRSWVNVEDKYQRDSIWIFWELIISVAKRRSSTTVVKIIDALLDMFCLKYTVGTKRVRKYILYNCISLLTEPVDTDIPIWKNTTQILLVSKKINVIYKEIKKNEITQIIDVTTIREKSNLTRTIEKLEIMNKTMSS